MTLAEDVPEEVDPVLTGVDALALGCGEATVPLEDDEFEELELELVELELLLLELLDASGVGSAVGLVLVDSFEVLPV